MLAAGIGVQLASLLLFFGILYWFFARLTAKRHLVDNQHPYAEVRQSSRFKVFILCACHLPESPLSLGQPLTSSFNSAPGGSRASPRPHRLPLGSSHPRARLDLVPVTDCIHRRGRDGSARRVDPPHRASTGEGVRCIVGEHLPAQTPDPTASKFATGGSTKPLQRVRPFAVSALHAVAGTDAGALARTRVPTAEVRTLLSSVRRVARRATGKPRLRVHGVRRYEPAVREGAARFSPAARVDEPQEPDLQRARHRVARTKPLVEEERSWSGAIEEEAQREAGRRPTGRDLGLMSMQGWGARRFLGSIPFPASDYGYGERAEGWLWNATLPGVRMAATSLSDAIVSGRLVAGWFYDTEMSPMLRIDAL